MVGVDDADFGKRLAAFVVSRTASDLDAEEVKSYVRAHLARHKVPRDVVFIDALPRNETGKVLRNSRPKSTLKIPQSGPPGTTAGIRPFVNPRPSKSPEPRGFRG